MKSGGAFADLAVLGASVRTLHPQRPVASAVAVQDGSIIVIGDDAEVREVCDGRTLVIDGSGMTLVPGLVDSHQHGVSASDVARGVDLTGCTDLEELRRRLAAERDRVGDEAWVLGWGADYAAFGSGGLSAAAIEEAVKGQPALIRTYDFHTGLASRAALALARVTGPVDLGNGSAVVCHGGVPTGELREHSAVELVGRVVPRATRAEAVAAAAAALAKAASCGITAIHQMDGDVEKLEVLRTLEERGDLGVRVVVAIWQHPHTGEDETRINIDLMRQRGGLWRSGVAKFFLDGVIDTGTAWLCQPDSRGRGCTPFWPDIDRFRSAVHRFSAEGVQCVTHAIGDAAVHCALDAYRDAPRRMGSMHRIEHIELLQDEDVPRFANEGVAASFQPIHQQCLKADGSDHWSSAVGAERTRRAFRIGDLLRSGAVVTFGSDWPVASCDPRMGMAWARLRRPPRGNRPSLQPEQVISGIQALECYTAAPARAVGEEAVAGRLAPGYRADLTGFADDPVQCSGDDLPELPVTLTIVNGRIVWQTG